MLLDRALEQRVDRAAAGQQIGLERAATERRVDRHHRAQRLEQDPAFERLELRMREAVARPHVTGVVGRRADPLRLAHRPAAACISESRSSSSAWAGLIFSRARSSVNHSARSTSGTSISLPDRGGHSSSNVLLVVAPASRSPAMAQTRTSLPPFWRTSPSSRAGPSGTGTPSSSSNSRRAAASGSSSGAYSPLGIDQAPASRRAQNGPPGWTSSTANASPRRR